MSSSLLLLPGFDGTGKLFAPLLAALGSDYLVKVVRYEHEAVLDDYVSTAAAELPGGNTIVVAESFSGPVALDLISRFPERVRGVVLCATFMRSPFRPLTTLARFAPVTLFEPRALHEPLLRHFCLDHASMTMLPAVLEAARSMSAATIQRRLVLLSHVDMRSISGHVRIPTLILRSSRDRIVGTRATQELACGLPHARIESIDGPHLLLQARPHECASSIDRFARECAIEARATIVDGLPG